MSTGKSPKSLSPAQIKSKAAALLRQSDGLRILKRGTLGHGIALSAVEAALKSAALAPAPAAPPAANEQTEKERAAMFVRFVERFDNTLTAAGYTLEQRHEIVGTLFTTRGDTSVPAAADKGVFLPDILRAIVGDVDEKLTPELDQALSSACARVSDLLTDRVIAVRLKNVRAEPSAPTEVDGLSVEMDFTRRAPLLCKHCRRQKGNHKADTLNCPIGRGNFPSFSPNQVFEPRARRQAKTDAKD